MRQLASRQGEPGVVGMSKATIQRGENDGWFTRGFFLSPGVKVWDADEIEAFLTRRRAESGHTTATMAGKATPMPRSAPVPKAAKRAVAIGQEPRGVAK